MFRKLAFTRLAVGRFLAFRDVAWMMKGVLSVIGLTLACSDTRGAATAHWNNVDKILSVSISSADDVEVTEKSDMSGIVEVLVNGSPATINGGTVYNTDVEEIYVDGSTGADTIDCSAVDSAWTAVTYVEIRGYGGDDTIYGTQLNDVIYGGDGTDDIDGEGGDDLVGDEIWVDGGTAGDDNNKGTLVGSPLKTIQAAIDMATDGAVINVKGGVTYVPSAVVETGFWTGLQGGKYFFAFYDKNNITMQPSPGTGTPIISGWYNNAARRPHNPQGNENTRETGLLTIEDCQDITIKGMKIENSGQVGITVMETRDNLGTGETRTENITIEDCEVDDTYSWGILVQGKTPDENGSKDVQPYNITVKNCIVKNACRGLAVKGINNAAGEAIRIYNTDTFYVDGNHILDHYKEGINVIASSRNGEVSFNLIDDRNSSNTIYGNERGSSIYVDGQVNINSKKLQNIKIYGNVIRNDGGAPPASHEDGSVANDGAGIVIGSENGGDVNGVDIYNNVIITPSGDSALCVCGDLHVPQGATANSGEQKNIRIYNNTIVGKSHTSESTHVVLRIMGASNGLSTTLLSGLEIRNNIICRESNTDGGLIFNPLSAGTTANNVVWDGGGTITGPKGSPYISSNPNFTSANVTAGNQTITIGYGVTDQSAGYNQGETLSIADPDIRGVYRTDDEYEIGAFEVDD